MLIFHFSKPISRRLSLTAGITAVVIATMLASFQIWSAGKVDEISSERQAVFVALDLRQALDNLASQQRIFTQWPEALSALAEDDGQWVSRNLVARPLVALQLDQVAIVRDGDLPATKLPRDTIESVVETARHGSSASDLAKGSDGGIYIVSAEPYGPIGVVHLVIKQFDQAFTERISSRYDTTFSRISPDPTQPRVPITSNNGEVLGYLTWAPYRPGDQLLAETGPAILIGTSLMIGLLLLLLRGFRQASSDLESSKSHAQHLALHDSLTGLPNRILFDDRLSQALLDQKRSREEVGLLVLDLDHFKTVNDTLGHPAGDELIRQASKRLAACLRDVDTVARMGGDEFSIILPRCSEMEVTLLCERLVQTMEKTFDLFGDHVTASVSIGAAVSGPGTTDPVELMRNADIALYEAKTAQRGTFRLFTGSMDEVAKRRRTIESDLRAALSGEGQLNLAYQPFYSPRGDIVGAEALIRWEHPIHGALPPEQFIRIAEERGLIVQLGRHVLREACLYARNSTLPWVAVNVSPVQIRKPTFAADVLAVLDETGLSPHRLQLEVTEGVLLDPTPAVLTTLNLLRDRGIRLSLDDFGTGYSSLSYLRSLELDKIKIDRSFVVELGRSKSADAVVQAIIQIARSLALQITAEGVETVDQHARLVAMGCDEIQGFLLAKPMSGDELAVHLNPPTRLAVPA